MNIKKDNKNLFQLVEEKEEYLVTKYFDLSEQLKENYLVTGKYINTIAKYHDYVKTHTSNDISILNNIIRESRKDNLSTVLGFDNNLVSSLNIKQYNELLINIIRKLTIIDTSFSNIFIDMINQDEYHDIDNFELELNKKLLILKSMTFDHTQESFDEGINNLNKINLIENNKTNKIKTKAL